MRASKWSGVVILACGFFAASAARAQCTMDAECKGDRVCEGGQCVSPPPNPATAPTEPAPAVSPAPAPSTSTPAPRQDAPAPPPRMQRHSTGMMAGGIVMVSLAPIALLVAGIVGIEKNICDIDNTDRGYGGTNHSWRDCSEFNPTLYGSLLTGVALLGVGVPLIVVGAKKEPVEPGSARATIAPWATPSAAGVALHLAL